MPTGETLPIRIVEGGESLYLYPYAIFTNYRSLHFEYLHLQEFWPYWDHMQDFLSRDRPLGVARRFWFLIVRRFWAALIEWWRHSKFSWWRSKPWWHLVDPFGGAWRLCYPLRCSSLCPVRLGIDSQLRVQDTRGITETDYLIPSPAYLLARIEEQEKPPACRTERLEDWVLYRQWLKGLPMDCDIRFVVELDT